MRRWLLALLATAFVAGGAHADEMRPHVSYQCQKDRGRIELGYAEKVHRKGQPAPAPSGLYEVDLATLVAYEGDIVARMMSVTWRCELADGIYRVTVGPQPGNLNITRRCGAALSGWVEVVSEDRRYPRVLFREDCSKDEKITRAVYKVGASVPDLTKTRD